MRHGSFWVKAGLAVVLGMSCVEVQAGVAQGLAGQEQTGAIAAAGGSVWGAVKDESGAVVAGAKLTLLSTGGATLEAVSEEDGSFLFPHVPVGSFTLTVTAEGLENLSVKGAVEADEGTEVEPLLRVATVRTEVNAVSQWEEAEIEMHDEEKQRLLWILPNFYVSYVADAAPMTTGQKFRLAGRTLVDPEVIVSAGVTAGFEQATDSYNGFGQGAAGFGRRAAASYGDSFVGILLGGAVLPSIFHQDPRYFYKGTGSVKSRLWYVVTRSVVQKGDNGRWQPGYSNVLGDLGSALLSDTYYPVTVKNWGSLTAETFGISIAGDAVSNLLQEFVYARWTSKKKQ